jgi:L-fuconolactonase
MPNFPIIDTHLHVWDHARLKYSAFESSPLFSRNFHVEDYRRDLGAVEVEAMVFLECYADFWEGGGQYIKEILFVEEEARRDPGIKAIVPMAPLEWGSKAEPILAEMKEKHPMVRGIRRIPEFDADPRGLMLSDGFIEGVSLLGKFGYHFEINVHHHQMDIVREFVKHIPDVPMILDHCGKPGIKEGAIAQFRDDVKDLARYPNLFIKLSDLPVEADLEHWTDNDLRPFIDATFESFGVDRTLFAMDWPICLQATSMTRWVETLDRAMAGFSEAERRKFYRDNANSFYRLGL